MHIDAKRMPQPMSEILPVAFLRDDIPRDTVNVRAVRPGSESILMEFSKKCLLPDSKMHELKAGVALVLLLSHKVWL